MFYVDENKRAVFSTSRSFPIIIHETNLRDKPLGYNSWHWHEELQLTIVLSGEIMMTMQGSNYVLRPRDGIFIASNIEHMTQPTTPDSARYLSVNFHPALLTLFMGSVFEQKYFVPYMNDPHYQVVPLYADNAADAAVLGAIQGLMRVMQDVHFGYELTVCGEVLNVWKMILERGRQNAAVSNRKPHVERIEARNILAYLQDHYAEQVVLDDISAQVHVSKSECCRMFRAAYGCSIFSYLTDYRLQKSTSLLLETDASVMDISGQCAFGSTSYYIKTFREKVGQTPLQYRFSATGRK